MLLMRRKDKSFQFPSVQDKYKTQTKNFFQRFPCKTKQIYNKSICFTLHYILKVDSINFTFIWFLEKKSSAISFTKIVFIREFQMTTVTEVFIH